MRSLHDRWMKKRLKKPKLRHERRRPDERDEMVCVAVPVDEGGGAGGEGCGSQGGRHAGRDDGNRAAISVIRVEPVACPRQWDVDDGEIHYWRVKGCADAEIAERLFITVAATKTHVARLLL